MTTEPLAANQSPFTKIELYTAGPSIGAQSKVRASYKWHSLVRAEGAEGIGGEGVGVAMVGLERSPTGSYFECLAFSLLELFGAGSGT